ncbi:hypothetical protein SNE40_018331 [Patella caerulea]|uniref:Uncharacterized protein n=1 Tax=Patella caerulea TaxID=87958 RepID=A0AAN8J8J1_PATCE
MYKKLPEPPEKLIPGGKLCAQCRFSLQKLQKEHPIVIPEDDNDSDETDKDPPSEKDEPLATMMTTSSPEKESSFFEVNSALPFLNETPVKLHQLPSSSKRSTGKRKLASATTSLKKKHQGNTVIPSLRAFIANEIACV